MRNFLATLSVTLMSVSSSAHAQSSASTTVSYSATDLAAGKIVVAGMPDGATVGPELEKRKCKTTIDKGSLTIERSDDENCLIIFGARQPQDLAIDIVLKPASAPTPPKRSTPAGGGAVKPPAAAPSASPVRLAFTLLFDHGLNAMTRGVYDPKERRIDFKDKRASGRLAYYLPSARRWSTAEVTAGIATLGSEDLVDDVQVFYRPTGRMEVVAVSLFKAKAVEAIALPPVETACADTFKKLPPHKWESVIDAANPSNALQVVTFPQIVEQNWFGVIVVRHSDQLVVAFDSTGTVKLEVPAMRDGSGFSGDKILPIEPVETEPPKYICTVYQVAPRGNGAFTITVTLTDPAKSSAKVSERKLDVIVLQRFAGAFRVGVAGVFRAPDQKFEARTSTTSTQAEIVRTQETPVELVLGYSIYFSSIFDHRGRSYFNSSGQALQDSHGGFFLGFGAVSVTGTNTVDFLKSLHLGLEYEFSPHFAVAVTGVLRRVDELTAGASVGGPAAMTIPTESKYVGGVGIVLNISPAFFKFAANVGK